MSNLFVCFCRWIEGWQRKQRQYQEDRCSNFPHRRYNFEKDEDNEYSCWDNGWDDDLREAFCSNKNNIPVLKALKEDIECGWSTASIYKISPYLPIFILAIQTFFHIDFSNINTYFMLQ